MHVLSELVFCPRAAVLALETGNADHGDDDPPLGPRLDGCYDYSEALFAEALEADWGELRRWLTLLAPAFLLPFAAWRFHSIAAAFVCALPALLLLAKLWDALRVLRTHLKAHAAYRAAPQAAVSLTPDSITPVNWWTLRKAGFDCLKPQDAYADEQLIGKPWRLLVKDTMWRIPVIRKHRGEKVCRQQHIVRAAAYCRLIETCEGGRAPFAVLMFAGSDDCLIVPNHDASRAELEQALRQLTEFLRIQNGGRYIPAEPSDNRCSGCHWGRPIPLREAVVLNQVTVPPIRIEGIRKGSFHCACGDRFNFVPRHNDTLALKQA